MNPNYQQVNAINPGNPQNDVNPRVMRTHNTFPMSYQHALTCRFGDETPFYVFDSEANDKVPFSSFHELRSYTLSSQFLDKLNMHKTYFSVPYKAIMPNTWDLFYVPPIQGDDVPHDVAPFFKSGFLGKLNDIATNFESIYSNQTIYGESFTSLLRNYLLFEMFFSDASLLSLLGCKLNKYFRYDDYPFGFEKFSNVFFDFLTNALQEYNSSFDSHFSVSFNGNENNILISLSDSDFPYQIRRLMEFCREHPDFQINLNSEFSFNSPHFPITINSTDIPINISRCCAYQLAYFHYLTNDKVDFIYSADLYRNTMLSYANEFASEIRKFSINGNYYYYDWCSGVYLSLALDSIYDSYADITYFNPSSYSAYIYLSELLSIRKSLKFGDYFTGSRPRPYAVGDLTAPVIGNGVSAIDMTQNILAQRFKNAVNKTGRKLSQYMKAIRGANTMPLLTDPKFLARDTTSIGTMEVENTASDQGNVVSLLRAEQSKYAFEADIEDPCIIIGVVSFSIPRMYCRTIDRFFFKIQREDYFNPYFQNIGDQEIYNAEKGQGGLTPFAYTLRHMEYKQRYPIASSGAVEYLPSWFMIADNEDSEPYNNISPEFIRSTNVEFDRFYKSLNGVTLSSYFHFIIRFVNESNPNRNMEYSPTIL